VAIHYTHRLWGVVTAITLGVWRGARVRTGVAAGARGRTGLAAVRSGAVTVGVMVMKACHSAGHGPQRRSRAAGARFVAMLRFLVVPKPLR